MSLKDDWVDENTPGHTSEDWTFTAAAANAVADVANATIPSANDRTLHVSVDGDDANDGLTVGAAKLTVAGALSALSSGGLIKIGAGVFTESELTIPSNTTIRGVGTESEIFFDTPNSALITLTDTQTALTLQDLHLTLGGNATGSILLDMSGSFKHSFRNVIFQGQHVDGAVETFKTQVGVKLRDNSGDNHWADCEFNNFGNAVRTDTIQNHFVNCLFSVCWKGVIGGDPTDVAHGAGCSLTNCNFVGVDASTDTWIEVTGGANLWWLHNIWIEGCDKGIVVGNGTAGPYAFGAVNCKVAAATTCISIVAARQTYLANIVFEADPEETPTDLVVNGTGAVDGVATNLVTTMDHGGGSYDIPTSTFPANWTYFSRANELADTKLVHPQILDANHKTALDVVAVADAVNYIAITNNATGSAPYFQAAGANTDIDLGLWAKNAGVVRANGNPVSTRVAVPANASSAGSAGMWATDGSYMYVCTAVSTWVRGAVTFATW